MNPKTVLILGLAVVFGCAIFSLLFLGETGPPQHPDICNLPIGILCTNPNLYADGKIVLTLRNRMAGNITICNIECSTNITDSHFLYSGGECKYLATLAPGEEKTVSVPDGYPDGPGPCGPNGPDTVGVRVLGRIGIWYYSSEVKPGIEPHISEGDIRGKIQT